MCRGWGLNPRPQAYESCALPTELPRHILTKVKITYIYTLLNTESKIPLRGFFLVAGIGIEPIVSRL